MGFFDRISEGLTRSRDKFKEQMNVLLDRGPDLDEEFWDGLEETLILADVGGAAAAEIERQTAALHGTQEKAAPQDALVIDDDISKIQYKLAKCCNPIKGDDVFGFVTINAGITIHRCDCPNAKRMRENYPYRVIDARWRQSAEGAFRVSIRIVAADTTGMANHITEVIIRDLKLNIRTMNFAPAGNGCVAGIVAVEVPGTGVVDTLIHQIMRIKGVQRAYRIN